MARTELTHEQLKSCLATGTPAADIRDWQSQGFDYDDILDLCNTSADARAAEKSGDAKRLAEANDKLQNPGNRTHPGISSYSRPKGERDDPKGPLPCRMTWGGTGVFAELLTAEEFDLLVSVQPGVYKCMRTDGTPMKVEVVGVKNEASGKYESLDVKFTTTGMLRHNLPSMVAMLKEIHQQADSRLAAPLAG